MTPSKIKLDICRPARAVVVGAGISGLSAAIALRRAGWHVQVLEKSQFKNEIGAAITITPNATLVLDRWGFDMEKAKAVPNQQKLMFMAGSTTVLQHEEYEDLPRTFGHGVWSLHRVDLHRGLRELATCAASDFGRGSKEQTQIMRGPPVDIQLGTQAVGLDCERGAVKLIDGRTVQADLVIVADGAHSRLIADFTGQPSTLKCTGRSVYRWLISMKDIMADPILNSLYTSNRPGFISWLDTHNDIFWVTYQCRRGEVLNVAVVHPTQPGEGDEDHWHCPVSQNQVLSTLANFHPSLQQMVKMANEDGIKVHRLYKRDVLTSFVRGKTAIIGDAAHLMMPTHAAGAGTAIESAAALEILFRGVYAGDEATVGSRLRLFDKLRVPRCNLIMLLSNAGPAGLRVPGVEEEVRKFYSGPLPDRMEKPYSRPFMELLFKHDEFLAAEQLLAEDQQKKDGKDKH